LAEGAPVLQSQDYPPLLDAQRLRDNSIPLPPTDRRVLWERTTRLPVLEAPQQLSSRQSDDVVQHEDHGKRASNQITARMLSNLLHPHPTTVYGHLKQLRAQGIIE
jgi:hypothetical protein